MADSTNKVYYFESALSPNIVWVNLNNINLGPGSGVRAVAVEDNYSIIGNIDSQLALSGPIAFLAPTAANTPRAYRTPLACGSRGREQDRLQLVVVAADHRGAGATWLPAAVVPQADLPDRRLLEAAA